MKKAMYIYSLLLLTIFISGCADVKDRKTTLEIIDNNRHYYPILQGEILEMTFIVKNVGDVPFILSDVFTSCGCVAMEKSSIDAIPQKGEGVLVLKYDSNKNIGRVQHYATLYGNLKNSSKIEIVFDVHVVPSSLNTREYEELYHDRNNRTEYQDYTEEEPWTDKPYYLDKGNETLPKSY